MKNCKDCRIKLEAYLCNLPSKWREQIINVICDYLENQEIPCLSIINCLNNEMDTLDPKCLTSTPQVWQSLSLLDKLQLIINKLCDLFDIQQLNTEDTAAIILTGLGVAGDPLMATLKLSGDSGQIAEIRSDGLYVPDVIDICQSIDNAFVTDSDQKNADAQTYRFLVKGTECEKVAPPTGFAVTGNTRKSAFGAMEWFTTLTLANASAVSGETVLIYNDTTESLVTKNGVNYFGVGKKHINDVEINSAKSDLTNLFITDLDVHGTNSECLATNVTVTGAANFGGNCKWQGGKFLDNSTDIVIESSAQVSHIYSEKTVNVIENSKLSFFQIVHSGTTVSPLNINLSGTASAVVTKGYVYAPNLTSGSPGATFGIVIDTAKLFISDVFSDTIGARGMYLQCGDQDEACSLHAINNTGRSVTNKGLVIAANKLPSIVGNATNVIVDHCTGISGSDNGIAMINGNLKKCTAYSESGDAILIGGSDNTGYNLNIIDCIAESKGGYAIRCDRDCYIIGGTYISRLNTSAGNPIRLTSTLPTYDPDGDRGYCIVGVKTMATNTTAYAISGVAGAVVRISGCDFLNQFLLTNVPGIDPIITQRVVTQDGLAVNGNRK